MNCILNFIGSILRDILLMFDKDYIEYTYINNKYIYKSFLPFSFRLGNYVFLTEKDFKDRLSK